MSKCEEAVRLAKEGMEALGAKVVDISIYPATRIFPDSSFDVVIIAAYIPQKACLLTVCINVERNDVDRSSMTFTINGEFNEQGWNKYCQDDGHILVRRSPVGSESYCYKYFRINDYSGFYREASTIDKKIERGINFFKEFLGKYGQMLTTSFSEPVHLWYVPEHSDAFMNNEKKNGKYNDKNYDEFNAKVLAKFPKGIFSSRQYV